MILFDPFDPDPIETQDWLSTDTRLHLPNNTRLMKIAQAMDANHKGQADATAGWRTHKNRYVGLFGERAFARIFDLSMDLRLLRFGNRRKNFTLRDGTVVDVVTRSWEAGYAGGPMPELTIRHKERISKKVLCLVYYQGEHLEPLLKGWITHKEAFIVGRIEQFKDGIENVVVSPADLYAMPELLSRHNPQSRWLKAHEDYQSQKKAQEAARWETESVTTDVQTQTSFL